MKTFYLPYLSYLSTHEVINYSFRTALVGTPYIPLRSMTGKLNAATLGPVDSYERFTWSLHSHLLYKGNAVKTAVFSSNCSLNNL